MRLCNLLPSVTAPSQKREREVRLGKNLLPGGLVERLPELGIALDDLPGELLRYTLQSIGNGQEDVGIRFEGYYNQSQEKEKAQSQAALQSELDREASVVRAQLGILRPAA